jgi:hypothetical protein
MQTVVAISCDGDHVAFALEIKAQQGLDVRFVLNDQDA